MHAIAIVKERRSTTLPPLRPAIARSGGASFSGTLATGAVLFPQIFGKYVLERPLAVGGMARVFLATLRGAGGFEKKLVVKQIRAELATDDAFVRRFVAEAKTTVELSHPNIVPVYELGVEQGIYYLAMELCDGVTLAELLQKTGKLSPEEGAYVGIEICRALDYAHRKARVIHRDVTPRNVVIDEEGAVRLIDFGIAAPAYAGAKEVFGSPGHMSPEQLRGEEVGPPADVFAVATLLYEAWTGKPPFRRRTAEQSESALAEPVQVLSTFDPDLGAIDGLIGSAMAIDARERPQSAEDLSRPLRRFIAERDLGDLTRKLGDRVRDLRAGAEAEPLPVVSLRPGEVPPTVSETRTFATRSQESMTREATTPSRPPRPDTAPFAPTRRMNDDPGSWSTGRRSGAEPPSLRKARARPTQAMLGTAFGALAVVVLGGVIVSYSRSGATAHPDDRGNVTSRSDEGAPGASHGAEKGEAPRVRSAEGTAASATAPPARSAVPSSSETAPAPGAAAPETAFAAPATPSRDVALPHGAAPSAAMGSAAPAHGRGGSGVPPVRTSAGAPPAENAGAPGEAASAVGRVRILASPMANVEIDGQPRGAAPIADIALTPGTHFVRLDCAALGEAVAQNVSIAPGESITISGDFTGAHGRILVRRATP
jgi:serine/threonine-protein kinase